MREKNIVYIGLLGVGTVGSGVVNVLQRNIDVISKNSGCKVLVKKAVVRDLNKKRNCRLSSVSLSNDPYDVLNDPDISIVVEAIGGVDEAKTYVIEALTRGKFVVTANKALLADCLPLLSNIARENNTGLRYEAAVAGAIPIVEMITNNLSANRIISVAGVFNGTTNFILTEMLRLGSQFNEVLKKAKDLGYAEDDPSFDIDGIDSAQKLCILSALVSGELVNFKNIFVEGIGEVTLDTLICAKRMGCSVKLVGAASFFDNGIVLEVRPVLISQKCILAQIEAASNAVVVETDAAKQNIFVGQGAGDEPTASAIISDIVQFVKGVGSNQDKIICSGSQEQILPAKDSLPATFYIQCQINSDLKSFLPVSMSQLKKLFNKNGVTLLKERKLSGNNLSNVYFTFITSPAVESKIDSIVQEIKLIFPKVREIKKIKVFGESLGDGLNDLKDKQLVSSDSAA